MSKMIKVFAVLFASIMVIGCGERVEVPPAHVGKIMTKDGYADQLRPPSKFRLEFCMAYCDRLVLVDISDHPKREPLSIFMPVDKLNLDIEVQVTMSINPDKVGELFTTLSADEIRGSTSTISWDQIYRTYAQQIIITKVREYMSQFSIAEVASSLERVNSEMSVIIGKEVAARTPFTVRHFGVVKTVYPQIITDAQENAAKRREQIQQEEAQLEISKVQLQRELQEAQLKRQIELEKSKTEAEAQRIQREVVDERVLKLRALEVQRAWVEKWDGNLPATMMGDGQGVLIDMTGKR